MDRPDRPDSPGSPEQPEPPDHRTVPFPSPRNPQRPAASTPQSISPSFAPASFRPSSLNAPCRIYLYTPTRDELIHRSLDLAAQVGIATSHIDREIATEVTRDRIRRLFPSAPTAEN
jgi:hypothetical protein